MEWVGQGRKWAEWGRGEVAAVHRFEAAIELVQVCVDPKWLLVFTVGQWDICPLILRRPPVDKNPLQVSVIATPMPVYYDMGI